MSNFATQALPAKPTVTAPDGSDVRVLVSLAGGSMAHFALAAGKVSRAVVHRTVEELWYVLSGSGAMWRKQGEQEEVIKLVPCIPTVRANMPATFLAAILSAAVSLRLARAPSLRTVNIALSPPWHRCLHPSKSA